MERNDKSGFHAFFYLAKEKNGLDVSELPLIPICDEGRDAIDHYRAEAIKGFAERLKENIRMNCFCEKYVFEKEIDNLVKEMAGERE